MNPQHLTVQLIPQTPPVDRAAVLAEMKRTIPLQQRVPKSVRGLAAETLAGRIEVALNHPSDQEWWDLFIFPYLTLRQRTSPADQSMTNKMLLT